MPRAAALPRLVVLMALGLGACAGPPPPAPAPPLSYPPAAQARLLRFALGEWQDWGARTIAEDERPPTAPAESDPANFPRVLAYWRAVPREAWVIAENRARYQAALEGAPGGAALWTDPPWSAAFISWVMGAAGIDAREFPPSAAHSEYVDALIRDAAVFPDRAPFVPHLPADYAPRPGDLVCADRSRSPIRDWRARAADAGRFRPMHCDIVVATGSGWFDMIGGNVQDAVTRTRVSTDAGGVPVPAPPGAATRFAVFENRLGRLPPWTSPGTLAGTMPAGSPTAVSAGTMP